jgi:RNase P/RNase MRP subunit POP5
MVGNGPKERKRYIGFRIEALEGDPPSRNEMVDALDEASRANGLPDRRRLTVFEGNMGIAKCLHEEQGDMTSALNGIGEVAGRRVNVTTVITSGTIKKVKGHLGIGQ